MATRELHLELLLGKPVTDSTGKCIGRIEEVRAKQQGDEWIIHEYAFTRNITARVEYLYYDLGDKTYTTNAVQVGATSLQATAKAQFDGNIIRAGVNYKF